MTMDPESFKKPTLQEAARDLIVWLDSNLSIRSPITNEDNLTLTTEDTHQRFIAQHLRSDDKKTLQESLLLLREIEFAVNFTQSLMDDPHTDRLVQEINYGDRPPTPNEMEDLNVEKVQYHYADNAKLAILRAAIDKIETLNAALGMDISPSL